MPSLCTCNILSLKLTLGREAPSLDPDEFFLDVFVVGLCSFPGLLDSEPFLIGLRVLIVGLRGLFIELGLMVSELEGWLLVAGVS